MKITLKSRVLFLLSFASGHCLAYWENNHEQMSHLAVSASVLSSQQKLNQLGFYRDVDSKSQLFPVDISSRRTIRETIKFGARMEDADIRVVNHFFNPLTNEPLALPGPLMGSNATSPRWALEDEGIVSANTAGSQEYSYRLAKDYLLDALTNPLQFERDRSWAKTFRSMGQVMHHLQDMTQPQHARIDSHLNLGIGTIRGITNPSSYELWIAQHNKLETFSPIATYAPVYSPTLVKPFNSPRRFWTTSPGSVGTGGLGIAEFTNRNFYSMGTLNSPKFPEPVASTTDTMVDVTTLCQNAVVACPAGVQGMIHFTTTNVSDNLRPETSQVNPQARAFSALSWDLKKRGISSMYTLNRFTYDTAMPMLVSRAIGYSAGLINYFFRGQMSITLPSEGVYAAVDHTTAIGKDPNTGGFRTIKLRVQNKTPGDGPSGIEPMGTAAGGSMYAIVKYHRNKCYQSDLSGEYGAPGMDWKTCRDPNEEIVVSNKITAPAGMDAAPQELTFNFATPVPIRGTDMFLQVVYDGPLGQESRAIVVATRDISEPTYLYKYDIHDQFLYARYPDVSVTGVAPTYSWSDWCRQAVAAGDVPTEADCPWRLWPAKRSFQFSPTDASIPGWSLDSPTIPMGTWTSFSQQPALNPLAVLSAPVGSFARVAVLTDAVPTNPTIYVDDWNGRTHNFWWNGGLLQAALNQLDISTNTLTPFPAWARARGIYVSPADADFIGTPPPGTRDLPSQASTVNFPSAPVSP